MDTDTIDRLTAALRPLLTMAGGYLVQHGLATNDQVAAIVSGILTAGVVVWSVVHQHKQGLAHKTDLALVYTQGHADGAAQGSAVVQGTVS